MTPTVADILVPQGAWYNIYSLSGIPSGTQVVIYNKGSVPLQLASSYSDPAQSSGIPLYIQTNIVVAGSDDNDWWVYSDQGLGLISVQVIDLQKYRQGAAYTTQVHPMGMKFSTAVALNLVPGCRRIAALGNNPDIDTATTPEDIYPAGGLYPWPSRTTPFIPTVISTSVNDSSAGTGVRTISIAGLDINFNEQSETITMNGITSVPAVKQYIRINSVALVTAGTGEVNAGDINVLNGANVLARLPTGLGSPRSSNYTVPAGHTLSIDSLFIGINRPTVKTDATVSTYFGFSTGVYRMPLEISMDGAPYRHDTDPPIMVPEKADFILRGMYVSESNANITGAWNGILYQNSVIQAI